MKAYFEGLKQLTENRQKAQVARKEMSTKGEKSFTTNLNKKYHLAVFGDKILNIHKNQGYNYECHVVWNFFLTDVENTKNLYKRKEIKNLHIVNFSVLPNFRATELKKILINHIIANKIALGWDVRGFRRMYESNGTIAFTEIEQVQNYIRKLDALLSLYYLVFSVLVKKSPYSV